MRSRSQAARPPGECRFEGKLACLSRVGDRIILDSLLDTPFSELAEDFPVTTDETIAFE